MEELNKIKNEYESLVDQIFLYNDIENLRLSVDEDMKNYDLEKDKDRYEYFDKKDINTSQPTHKKPRTQFTIHFKF